ncbi:DTW domain protein [Klebsiella variicola]|uniref:tRNA-uridine aminocarboxypropyltransferase n=1 Tax=Klebsiella variicola TaxID=244366 RepID=A0A7H4MQH8_KLEVA|nr:DTW domain protein [Klebsiella variicola]
MVVFPASYAGPERQILSAPPSGKPPLFIMLDGTWTEARKMFRKSPYLDALPIISVDLSTHLCLSSARGARRTDNTVPRK